MESMMLLAPVAFAALISASRASLIARRRERDVRAGSALGSLLGTIGVASTSRLSNQDRDQLGAADRDCYLRMVGFGEAMARLAR
jgi:hypothetical protein